MNNDNSKQADYCALLFSILTKHISQQARLLLNRTKSREIMPLWLDRDLPDILTYAFSAEWSTQTINGLKIM